MAWSSYQICVAVLMVFTGSLNTLTTKWADNIWSQSSDGRFRKFDHPFTQSLFMFFGELMCLLAFKALFSYHRKKGDRSEDTNTFVKGNRDFPVAIFLIPAMCDMIATSLMYVGLTLTYASSFQMLRGALIPFVAMLSVAFLRKEINSREWFGIFIIVLGLIIVGVSDISNNSDSKSINNVITGDLLIILAQIIVAVQCVSEEYFVSGKDIPPLQAVGWEGIFGFAVLAFLHVPMYFTYVGHPFSDNPRGVLEDFPDAMVQIFNNSLLLVPLIGTIVSIAFFNFAGITMTKELSAATRTVLDSIRTIFIWIVSIAVGWQPFSPYQIIGFIVLILGMCCYHDILVTKIIRRITNSCREPYVAEIIIDQPADEIGS